MTEQQGGGSSHGAQRLAVLADDLGLVGDRSLRRRNTGGLSHEGEEAGRQRRRLTTELCLNRLFALHDDVGRLIGLMEDL